MRIRIGTSESGGTFHTQGEAIAELFNRSWQGADKCVVQTTDASIHNAEQLDRGELEFGFMASNWIGRAKNGTAPARTPSGIADDGVMKPQAGVTTTKPPTAPEQKPRTLIFFRKMYSRTPQVKQATAVAIINDERGRPRRAAFMREALGSLRAYPSALPGRQAKADEFQRTSQRGGNSEANRQPLPAEKRDSALEPVHLQGPTPSEPDGGSRRRGRGARGLS